MRSFNYTTTMEQASSSTSEFKTDMSVERLTGKFKTNFLLIRPAMIAFDILRIIGQRALSFLNNISVRIKVARCRLRSVIQDLIYWPASVWNTLTCKF